MDTDLDRARRGDRLAMARIVETHYDAVYRFCARRLGPEAAQDAAQETFLTAQKRIKTFMGNSSLSTWLIGIAHNHCRNMARKRRLEALAFPSLDEPCATRRDADDDPWPRGTRAEDPSKAILDRQALRKALSGLSREHLEVVLLHELDGLTYKEVAEVIGVPEGTVKSRLHHAFLELRRALRPSEPDGEAA